MMVGWLTIIMLYTLVLLYFTYIWRKIPDYKVSNHDDVISITVIVVFRNEEQHLPFLINSFKKIKAGNNLLNFIFVNDHSEDKSTQVLESNLVDFQYKSELVNLEAHEFGKKAGLQKAVSLSNSELIITTDADCSVDPDWVLKTVPYFNNTIVRMTTGNLAYQDSHYISKLLGIEFAAIIGVTGVSAQLGSAGMANAANMCFTREAFIETQPFKDNKHISTGDDVFLLNAIKLKYGASSIRFVKESLVKTQPPLSLTQFFNQRWRWASKWKSANNLKDRLPAVAVWLFHLIFIIGLILAIVSNEYELAIIGFSFKCLSEGVFINEIITSQKRKISFLSFGLMQLFYSLYVLFFGITANFVSYKWKGRVYGRANQ